MCKFFALLVSVKLKSSTHRRRDSTRQLRRVAVGGVYWALNEHSTASWVRLIVGSWVGLLGVFLTMQTIGRRIHQAESRLLAAGGWLKTGRPHCIRLKIWLTFSDLMFITLLRYQIFNISLQSHWVRQRYGVFEVELTQNIMTTTLQRHRQTNRQTTCRGNTALCVTSRGKNYSSWQTVCFLTNPV